MTWPEALVITAGLLAIASPACFIAWGMRPRRRLDGLVSPCRRYVYRGGKWHPRGEA